MPASDKILSAYRDLAHRYRHTWIWYSLLSLVVSAGLTCLLHLANRPFSLQQYLWLLPLSALLVYLFTGAIIVLDLFFQWKTATRMIQEDDRPAVPLSIGLAWRVLRGSSRVLLAPILAFTVWYSICILFQFDGVLWAIAPILAVVSCIASIVIFPRLNRSHVFVTSAALAGSDPAQSYLVSKTLATQHHAEIRILYREAFLCISWLVLKSGIAFMLMLFLYQIVTAVGYPQGNPEEVSMGAIFLFTFGLPPFPSISFIVLSSILCASMIALPYRSMLRWLCYREFTSVEDDDEKC